ncbi:transcriptional regulator [Caulobacter sp. AP07]|uniref:TetR/AcrR family transcriptional regulator n=1 Tax=Caulobacter sp. AP07 TaxID=1144304 RepID=UPI0002721B01|nr:TetR/AcrR family transcriptional regulator [Caulobacter sp. AP07]EJL34525.1 transcriptional regulator [Caulobacter sp. AP07]
MRVSRDQMQANRLRILDSASRLFREKGFEAVSVAEVMKAAGLTHGGFYGHFESKDDLIAQAIGHIFTAQDDGQGDLGAYLNAYLSSQHRDSVGEGCPTAALVADIRRETPAARLAMTEGFRSQIDRMAKAIAEPGAAASRRQAVGAWAAMVGAVVLARAIDDPALSDEILDETRSWIEGNLGETSKT